MIYVGLLMIFGVILWCAVQVGREEEKHENDFIEEVERYKER